MFFVTALVWPLKEKRDVCSYKFQCTRFSLKQYAVLRYVLCWSDWLSNHNLAIYDAKVLIFSEVVKTGFHPCLPP